jgi:hypothetical protein
MLFANRAVGIAAHAIDIAQAAQPAEKKEDHK